MKKTHCFYGQWPSAYNVVFFDDVVYTTVTHDPSAVSQWIHDVNSLYGHRLIVGLDVEWRPNHSRDLQNPAATLQLCVGRCCLIYQLIHSPYFPIQLIQFLSYSGHAFVGIEVKSDLEKLQRDHGIGHSANTVDLRRLAVDVYRMKELKYAGLKTMARTVLGKEMEKPKRVTRSGWDDRRLTAEQETREGGLSDRSMFRSTADSDRSMFQIYAYFICESDRPTNQCLSLTH